MSKEQQLPPQQHQATKHAKGGVEYQKVSDDYMKNRQLRRGSAGPVLLVGLGVGYVIAGQYAGWNFGLGEAGWGGLLIALVLMGTMYTAMCLSLAEMSSIIPTAGGGYGFARRAMGPWGGFLTGTAVLLEFVLAPAAVVTFIGAYLDTLLGISGPLVYLVFYAAFITLHLYGVKQVLKLVFGIAVVAVLGLAAWYVGIFPLFDASLLLDIEPTNALGSSAFLPYGIVGVWAALPYAMWFYLAVEGVPLAAEEARNPVRDVPRGLVGAVLILTALSAAILVLGPGAIGSAALQESGNPLIDALGTAAPALSWFVNIIGLVGLVSSFFCMIYAYSRQTFALSRAGYLPRVLSLTSKRKVPFLALIIPGVIGFLLTLVGSGDLLILVSVFGATLSYILMMLSHIILRVREPKLERPYRTPGGIFTSATALVLAVAALTAGFVVEPSVILYAAAAYAVMVAYFAFYSRHRLVAQAPEEEFAALEEAENELEAEISHIQDAEDDLGSKV
ncbi:ethanolamine permease [Pseudarthrobacter sp. NamE2]|uniref:ethanolamine permease n=1 Tax=Pseudarthrobacter sp. NamE2 TaxID=2576838 RepID=UPI0010FE9206|nr:ethanolamine permease [Pseudarthrobacter sp. NamE2]TLM83711.1 ethanolamine permease [Pseudarthrobacter sp. NamE2]